MVFYFCVCISPWRTILGASQVFLDLVQHIALNKSNVVVQTIEVLNGALPLCYVSPHAVHMEPGTFLLCATSNLFKHIVLDMRPPAAMTINIHLPL